MYRWTRISEAWWGYLLYATRSWGAWGGICPPIGGSAPLRRKKWSKSATFSVNFWIFAPSEMHFAPSMPPRKNFLVPPPSGGTNEFLSQLLCNQARSSGSIMEHNFFHVLNCMHHTVGWSHSWEHCCTSTMHDLFTFWPLVEAPYGGPWKLRLISTPECHDRYSGFICYSSTLCLFLVTWNREKKKPI